MTTRIAKEIASLKLELARIERALEHNADWIALRSIDPQVPKSDAERLKMRRRHERALAKNAAFVARKALSRAIVLLEGMPSVPDTNIEADTAAIGPLADKSRAHRHLDDEYRSLVRSGSAPSSLRSNGPIESQVIVVRHPYHAGTDFGLGSGARSSSGSSLLGRLRDTEALVEFDGKSYAAYHGEVEYAEVEIVRTGISRDKPVKK